VIISPFQFRLQRGIERFTYSLANQLVKAYDIKITILIWDNPKRVDWGEWDPKFDSNMFPIQNIFSHI
jgi:hypothetical protein